MKTTGLNFIEAVQAAKEGKKIHRTPWDVCVNLHFDKRDALVFDDGCTAMLSKEGYLATDWEIVPEPPKTMTFQEAVEHLRKHGGVVRRQSTNTHMRIDFRAFHIFESFSTGTSNTRLLIADIDATDWIAVEEE